MTDMTQILLRVESGDQAAADDLLPLVYYELRRLAARKLRLEKPGQTLQATALVHEAYIRLVRDPAASHWQSLGHFYSAAAEAMRRILIENARRKKSLKAGGALQRVELEEVKSTGRASADDLLALDEALAKLERDDPVAANLAKLRLFAGLSVDEAATRLGMSRASGFRYWTYARAFLNAELSELRHE